MRKYITIDSFAYVLGSETGIATEFSIFSRISSMAHVSFDSACLPDRIKGVQSQGQALFNEDSTCIDCTFFFTA